MGHVTVLWMVGRWDENKCLSWGLFEKKKNDWSIYSLTWRIPDFTKISFELFL